MPAAAAARCLGRHLLLELRDCDPLKLSDAALVEAAMLQAARAARATVLRSLFHAFNPRDAQPAGVSGVVVIAESHLSIHTWPEHGLAAVDLFTSGETARPELAVPVLTRALGARSTQTQEIPRPWLTAPSPLPAKNA